MPPDELLGAVESLRSLAPRLNKLTDDANDLVRDVEHFLNEECSVGVQAYTKIESFSEGGGKFLEYRRVGPKYRIALVVAGDEGEDHSVKPWSECSRHEKLDSFNHLPDLLTAISKKVEEEINRAEETAKTIGSTLASVRKPKPPSPPRPKTPGGNP